MKRKYVLELMFLLPSNYPFKYLVLIILPRYLWIWEFTNMVNRQIRPVYVTPEWG